MILSKFSEKNIRSNENNLMIIQNNLTYRIFNGKFSTINYINKKRFSYNKYINGKKQEHKSNIN